MGVRACFIASLAASASAQALPDCTNGGLADLDICNASLPVQARVESLIRAIPLQQKFALLQNRSPGVKDLLPAYNWWGEALHGVAAAPGVNFSDSDEFSYATSFPQPVTMAAAFDDDLIFRIGDVISTEARAFSNAQRAPLDYWTPNINPFRDPRWGRGQETPGEDPLVVKSYIKNMVRGLQGEPDAATMKVIATCKHFAAYDMEFWEGNNRYGFDAVVELHDLAAYYMQPFQECARDTKVGSIMCAYNAVNGVPSCANNYLIETVLRGHWNWTDDGNYITSDCTAIQNMFSDHHSFDTRQATVSAALNNGVDVDCGYYYPTYLASALEEGLIEESTIDRHLTRLYSALVKVGYFDDAEGTSYRTLDWQNVSTPESEALALEVAEEGIVLLKNDGTLPISVPDDGNVTMLLVGGWLNATTQMQGIYAGPARILVSPWAALQNVTNVNIEVVQWYESPLLRAQEIDPDYILMIDATSEAAAETQDRNTIAWAGLQIDAAEMLATYGKPFIVAHMGEQCDDAAFLRNPNISAILWAGYPGMFGGEALVNVLTGQVAPAARMPITQYPADYVKQVPMTDMGLRPNANTGNPGRTYKYFDNATVEFGYGLHYTNFSTSLVEVANTSFAISDLVSQCDTGSSHIDTCAFKPDPSSAASVQVNVTNTGTVNSDFVVLAFVASDESVASSTVKPIKSLVAYQRLFDITPGNSQIASLNITFGGLALYDESGNEILYPGKYRLLIDVPTQTTWEFELTGESYMLDEWPAA